MHIKEAPRQSLGGGGRERGMGEREGLRRVETHTFTLLGAVYYPNGGSTVTSALSALPGTAGQARLSGVLGSVRL